MITDTRKKHIIFGLVAVEIVAAMVVMTMATLPGMDFELVAILISTAVLSLTIALLEIIVYIRHTRTTEERVFNPQV